MVTPCTGAVAGAYVRLSRPAMLTNAFINKITQPGDAELAAVLGPAKAAWDQLLPDLDSEHGANGHEWKCWLQNHAPKD